MDASTTESSARTILAGLGFSPTKIESPVHSLSGGWRSRCALACALMQQASIDVLLLDEPTNFLDLPAVIWFQDFIQTSLPMTSVVIVTHDRDFADAVADELILLRVVPAKTLETFKGNLSDYQAEKRRQVKRMTRMKEAQDKKVKHMEETISSNMKAAKRTGDDKKLKQAAARRKKLEEWTGLEVSASGNRFKLNRDRAGFQLTKRAEIEIPELDPPVSISFAGSPEPLRFPGPLVALENVTYRYPGSKEVVIKGVSLTVHPGERVGLAGLNGAGKSTLVKIIMAANDGTSLPSMSGKVTKHSRARIGYYSQHAVEELERLGESDEKRNALSHLLDVAGGDLVEQEARSVLAGLGLRGNVVSEVPLKLLSGGQRVRLALAQITWSTPHLLILDEVTTHLDSDTIVALVEALLEWEGALMVVTHDRFFMRTVVEREPLDIPGDVDSDDDADGGSEAKPGVVYRLRNGLLKKLEGGMNEYEELLRKNLAKSKKS